MKPSVLLLMLVATGLAACSGNARRDALAKVEPVFSVRHSFADAQANYQLGRYYLGQKRFELAEKSFQKAISIDPKHIDALNALGTLYAERGELPRALEMFEKVTAMAPEAAYLFNNLGLAYYLAGDLDKAFDTLSRAVTLDGNSERGWSNLMTVAKASAREAVVADMRSRQIGGQVVPTAPPVADSTQALSLKLSSSSTFDPRESSPVLHNEPPVLAVVTSDRVAEPEGGMILLANAPVQKASIHQERVSESARARLEVSNGNGVTGLARKLGKQLANDHLHLTRVTNHKSYTVTTTVIEYQPGFESAARSLAERLGIASELRPSGAPQARADIRLLLGKNAVPTA